MSDNFRNAESGGTVAIQTFVPSRDAVVAGPDIKTPADVRATTSRLGFLDRLKEEATQAWEADFRSSGEVERRSGGRS